MSGFIYLWYDRSKKKFYIGSHWGKEDDGYICSSTWMLQAYKKRPEDFRRRILERVSDYEQINIIEHRWLSRIKKEELGKRYYNLRNTRFGHWTLKPDITSVRKKISATQKAKGWRPPLRTGCVPWNKGRPYTSEEKMNISEATAKGMSVLPQSSLDKMKPTQFKKNQIPWNKGMTNKDEYFKSVMPPAWNKGRKGCFSEETRKKMSEAKIGRVPWNKGRKGIPNNIKYTPELRQKMSEQARAKAARLPKLFHNNEWKTLADWCRFYEISRYSVHRRLKRGWSLDKALNTPCPKIRKIQSRM